MSTLRRACLVTTSVCLLLTSVAWAKDPKADNIPAARDDIFPLSAIRPGIKGYGLTVKSGTKVERFEVEVIDIMPNYLAKQDVILVRCLGDEFADHQVAQGMSGSPVYFRDRLAGALSYTWSWAKHPLAAITPIEVMLAEGERPLEGRPTGAEPPTPIRRKPVAGVPGEDAPKLRPIGTPLAISGFSGTGRALLEDDAADWGFTLCGGGAVGGPGQSAPNWVNLDAKLEPGSAMVIELLRGDFNASVLGTCTHVQGDKAFGFGHSFSTMGETLLPMCVGYVHTVVASRQLSFKMGGPIRPVGAIVQDRPSGVVGVMGQEAPMIPFRLRFRNAVTKRSESFAFEVTPNRLFFTRLLIAAMRESFSKAEATLGSNTKRYRMTVKIKGMEPWTYEDVIAGFDGGFRRVLMQLVDRPLNHPTQRPEFESIDLDVEIEHTDRRAVVRSLTASKDEARPGDELTLRVALEHKEAGKRSSETLRVRIPHDAPGGNYAITVLGGDYVPADVAAPVDIADFPKLYEAFHKSTELVAVLPTARVDLDLDGRLLRGLPLSSVPRLVRSPGGLDAKLRPVTEKVRKPVDFVVSGSKRVIVRVVR